MSKTTPVNKTQATKGNISGFGKQSGTDYSMLINMVYILIGFMISTTEGFLNARMAQLQEQLVAIDFSDLIGFYLSIEKLIFYKSPIAETWMFLNGSLFLICFLFYLAEYYEKIWVEIFIQPKDKIFFRFYCILIGVYVILLKLLPTIWPIFFSILAALMMKKKWSTRDEIRQKIEEEHSGELTTGRVNSIYVLSDAMAYNFSILGSISLIIISLMTYFSLRYHSLWVFLLLSLSCVLMCLFWLKKVKSGIDEMMSTLNEGSISNGAFSRVFS